MSSPLRLPSHLFPINRASGPLPETVVVEGNKLTVRKVDDAVNTTFICEVKNRLGSSRNQITTVVIGESINTAHTQTSTHAVYVWTFAQMKWKSMYIYQSI